MQRAVDYVIHTNVTLEHQVQWAEAFRQGFEKHGIDAEVTFSRSKDADVHVLMGPWYALRNWQHQRVLYLDRCFYGDTNEVAQIGWRTPDGRVDYRNESSPGDRWQGECAPWKQGHEKAIVLSNYGSNDADLVNRAKQFYDVVHRRHPAEEKPKNSLNEALEWADVAIGYTSTALVQAILAGVPVVCLDDRNIVYPMASHSLNEPLKRCDRRQWCHDLAYTQWTFNEVSNGDAWNHLSNQ